MREVKEAEGRREFSVRCGPKPADDWRVFRLFRLIVPDFDEVKIDQFHPKRVPGHRLTMRC